MSGPVVKGRFAPSPTGRMHLGNVATALLSWLSVKSRGGEWLLRIEDLDPQRSRLEWSQWIEDDLSWLGLMWDEGGLADRGSAGPYSQSRRGDIYSQYLERLRTMGAVYPCCCRRRDILATQAPHQTDGRVVYSGRCRPEGAGHVVIDEKTFLGRSTRLFVGDVRIAFSDGLFGAQSVSLARECGDFILRRADGAWAYQLAVVVDDALMGVTEVARGCDLLLSAAQQIYLFGLLGYPAPTYYHLPLIGNEAGQRLCKRDPQADMSHLRERFTPDQLLGLIANMLGLAPTPDATTLERLLADFSWDKVPRAEMLRCPDLS
ncbi:MAG: tRNA glutamyl-Q(34) synthetase GluQRS [Paramuribaculum sp.]|nr:tRNA glutamyl-Q(34) synthetase GluQRS [Paramuribaculum sp.]